MPIVLILSKLPSFVFFVSYVQTHRLCETLLFKEPQPCVSMLCLIEISTILLVDGVWELEQIQAFCSCLLAALVQVGH
jgi:hypothetical protein